MNTYSHFALCYANCKVSVHIVCLTHQIRRTVCIEQNTLLKLVLLLNNVCNNYYH